ncbi:MAG TPA: tetraacyldisaccharide 4'-kinase, partial [Calditrichaeota bacterium]|nr:tetraacyldisaccharide 4'-kinase [Calditrichota bacterium]
MKIFGYVLKIVLLPFALLYGIVMEIRNGLYAAGILKTHRFAVPVISVGNLTTGGTGKTPFTIYLASLLKERYPRLTVVSRGYGRKSKGLQVVSNGNRILLSPKASGDEPSLIAHKLSATPVLVA